jgi:CHAT domain
VPLSRQSRIRTSTIAVGSTLVILAVAMAMLLLLKLPASTALAFAASMAGLHATYIGIHLATITSGWFPTAARTWLLAAIWAGLIGVAGAAVTTALWGGSGPLPVLVGVGLAAAALPVVHQSAAAGVTSGSPLPSQVRTMKEAEAAAAVRSAEVQLAGAELDPIQRAITEIQRATALTALALHSGRPDRLGEIVDVLERHARTASLPHGVRWASACGLVEARDIQAEVTRDDHGWEGALELQKSIAGEPAAEPWEQGLALHDAGDRQLFITRSAVERGDDAREPARRAYVCFRTALQHFGENAAYAPLLRLKVAQQAFALAMIDPSGSRLVSIAFEIGELREVLQLFRGRRREGRELVRLALAWLLLYEIDDQERLTPGLAEAEAIADAVLGDRRMAEIAGSAHEIRAEAARLRLAFTPELRAERQRALRAQRVRHLRAAFEAHTALSIEEAARSGLEWARAVAAEDDVTAAADAYARLVRQVSVETLRRLDYRDRAAFVADFQGTATEAGRWLAKAGRLEEAVEAIENARAILLGQRAARLPDDLAGALHRAGRDDLYAAYAAAVRDVDERERAAQADGDERERAAQADGDRDAAHRARSAFDAVRREVSDLLGNGDGTALADARAVAPLVYLGAAEPAGYAIVITADGAIIRRELPEAIPRVLEEQLAAYRLGQANSGAPLSVLKWVWHAVMAPIMDVVAAGPPVTIVALGGLGVLPLHAAIGPQHGPDEVGTIRYAPSARMAARARADAERAERRPQSLLVVSVPNAPGENPLPFIEVEAGDIARLQPSVHLADATRAATLAALPAATVWHFACHGSADLAEPLDSQLTLMDRNLTVRSILALPAGAYRLAVLSACESAVPDAARLDEMIGLPAALLQAGVAGVVATGWPVQDRAAAAFAIRLHGLLAGGVAPAVAVRRTRIWMRTVTNGELQDELGPNFGPKREQGPESLAWWRAKQPYSDPRWWGAFSLTGT